MSKYIRIDQKKIAAASADIEKLISYYKSCVRAMQQEIRNLSANWEGTDSSEFVASLEGPDGVYANGEKLVEQLQDYLELLLYTANQYKAAQAVAERRANMIPV